jgi:hypothetical protein
MVFYVRGGQFLATAERAVNDISSQEALDLCARKRCAFPRFNKLKIDDVPWFPVKFNLEAFANV